MAPYLNKFMINTIIIDFGGVLGTDSDTIFYKALKKHGISRKKALEILQKHWLKMLVDDERIDKLWETTKKCTSSNIEIVETDYNNLISVDHEMLNLCKDLKQKGYKLGVLANETYDWMNIKRKKGNLDEIFNVVYSSADIKFAKPDKKAFLKIIESLKAKPEECIFIDDRDKNIFSAEKLGIKSILFKNLNKLIKDLTEINII